MGCNQVRYFSSRILCTQSIPKQEKRSLYAIFPLRGSIFQAAGRSLRLSKWLSSPACFLAVCLLYIHPLINYVDMLFICRIESGSSGTALGTRP